MRKMRSQEGWRHARGLSVRLGGALAQSWVLPPFPMAPLGIVCREGGGGVRKSCPSPTSVEKRASCIQPGSSPRGDDLGWRGDWKETQREAGLFGIMLMAMADVCGTTTSCPIHPWLLRTPGTQTPLNRVSMCKTQRSLLQSHLPCHF